MTNLVQNLLVYRNRKQKQPRLHIDQTLTKPTHTLIRSTKTRDIVVIPFVDHGYLAKKEELEEPGLRSGFGKGDDLEHLRRFEIRSEFGCYST